METCLKLQFTMPSAGAAGSEAVGLTIRPVEENITVAVTYDFRDTPLVLIGDANEGDEVTVTLLPYRIELAVAGKKVDEEWPAGRCLYTPSSPFLGDISVTVGEEQYIREIPPTVVNSFIGAEGWRPDESVYVGDCMPYTDEGVYHVLYLKDRHHHQSKWGLGAHQWEHISTEDFVTWHIHPMAVEITDWQEGSICTGSWIKKGTTHYLYYTVRMTDGTAAPIRRSLSDDGYHYTKDENFSFTLSEKYHTPSARDPKVILDENGLYHILLTTSLLAENKGCLAHLTSPDLENWTEQEPIYIHTDNTQPECPDYIFYDGTYYLIFSIDGVAQYRISQNPFTGWRIPANPVIPCESVPKGATWQGKIVSTGFSRIDGYAGTLAFTEAHKDEQQELVFQKANKFF